VLSAEISVQNSIDQAIKDGVNAALVEISGVIQAAVMHNTFKHMTSFVGDGTTVEFAFGMYGSGAIYLNGLLQEEGVDYTFSSGANDKGDLVGTFTFNVAPEAGSSVVIYGQSGQAVESDWYYITPLV